MSENLEGQGIDNAEGVNDFRHNAEVDNFVAEEEDGAEVIEDESDESGVESLEDDHFHEVLANAAMDGLDIEDSEASENEENNCVSCGENKAKAIFSACRHQCICLICKYATESNEVRNQPDDPDRLYWCLICQQLSPEIIRVRL